MIAVILLGSEDMVKSALSAVLSGLLLQKILVKYNFISEEFVGAILTRSLEKISAIVEVHSMEALENSGSVFEFYTYAATVFACFVNYSSLMAKLFSKEKLMEFVEWVYIIITFEHVKLPTLMSVISVSLSKMTVETDIIAILAEESSELIQANYRILMKIKNVEISLNEESGKEINEKLLDENGESEGSEGRKRQPKSEKNYLLLLNKIGSMVKGIDEFKMFHDNCFLFKNNFQVLYQQMRGNMTEVSVKNMEQILKYRRIQIEGQEVTQPRKMIKIKKTVYN